MTIMKTLEKISDIGKNTEQKQKEISITEVWYLWHLLTQRYDAYEANILLSNFVDAAELKVIMTRGRQKLEAEISQIEKMLDNYGSVMPPRPAKYASYTNAAEMVNDRFIFRRVFMGMQGAISIYAQGVSACNDPVVRNFFRKQLNQEIDMLDGLFEYGKLKQYTDHFPAFRT